jgi:hypothetical protein
MLWFMHGSLLCWLKQGGGLPLVGIEDSQRKDISRTRIHGVEGEF